METEALSNYEQTQDKHITIGLNISRNEQDLEPQKTKEFNMSNAGIEFREEGDITDAYSKLNNCESLDNKENVNTDCVRNSTKIDGDNGIGEEDKLDDDNESIESEDKSLCESIPLPLSDEEEPLSDDLLSDIENNERGREKVTPIEENDLSDKHEDKQVERDEVIDAVVDDDVGNSSTHEEKHSEEEGKRSAEDEKHSDGEENAVTNDNLDKLNNVDGDKEESLANDLVDSPEKDIVDETNHSEKAEIGANKSSNVINKEGKGDETSITDQSNKIEKDSTETAEVSAQQSSDVNNEEAKESNTTEESNKNDLLNDKDVIKDDETEGNNKEDTKSVKTDDKNEEDSEKKDITEMCPLLKETLTKIRLDDGDQQREVDENGIDDIEMDEDFDPSLLCPDIAMEVDEAPVITNSDTIPNDGNKSPSLYEPMFSTYVDEMTGAEVSFNLTAEEQQLRHETYGESNPVQYTRIHCTACNVHLGSALDGQSNRFVHPLMKVLICKDCYHFYTSGEFEKDEDGSELYCRWCGQGGQVMCCANCEMVFCKKCIRINYGRKKLTEIKDSDDWMCFRCNPSQLISLRVHCCEFIEYVRREISRAATLENAASFMSTDFSQCCVSQKKKYTEPASTSEPKKKRKKTQVDPDYDPIRDIPSPQPSTSFNEAQVSKPVSILPKPTDPGQNAGVVTQVTQAPPRQMFKVGQTTFRPRAATGFSQSRPRVQVVSSLANVPTGSGPGYIKIMPGGVRVAPRPSRAQTFVSSTSGGGQSFQTIAPRNAPSHQMKHEWFEKTVRAAARVNSNLSYTLTQLNRAQATATSVEALAVVHNKLQEILSTSINSLIQIRKNLRTEFIAGIKNIRFPPKPPAPQTSTASQDDDVIFISPTQSPVPPPILPSTSSTLNSLNLPSSVSLTKRFLPPLSSSSGSSPVMGVTKNENLEKPKVFLRVKSLTALQNVTSECITIPDDPIPAPPPPLSLIRSSGEVTIFESTSEKQNPNAPDKDDVVAVIEDDPLKLNMEEDKTESPAVANSDKHKAKVSAKEHKDMKKPEDELFTASDLKAKHCHLTAEQMLASKVKVCLRRSKEIDDLALKLFGAMNGDASV